MTQTSPTCPRSRPRLLRYGRSASTTRARSALSSASVGSGARIEQCTSRAVYRVRPRGGVCVGERTQSGRASFPTSVQKRAYLDAEIAQIFSKSGYLPLATISPKKENLAIIVMSRSPSRSRSRSASPTNRELKHEIAAMRTEQTKHAADLRRDIKGICASPEAPTQQRHPSASSRRRGRWASICGIRPCPRTTAGSTSTSAWRSGRRSATR